MKTQTELASKSTHEMDSRAINEVEESESVEEITTLPPRQVVAPDFRSLAAAQPRKFAPMKYRNRLAIASTILQVARLGTATKTRLMYGAFLSFAQINEYLSFLLRTGLIMNDSQTHIYSLTGKGMKFVAKYEELSDLIDEHVEVIGA